MLFTMLLSLILGLLAFVGVLPYAFTLLCRLVGNSLRSRTLNRRDILLQRCHTEEKEQAKEREETPVPQTAPKTASSSTSLDSDWEKVNEGGNKTPTGQQTPATSNDVDTAYNGVIGFFHPFCNAGGGGERVLFAAVLATQRRYPNALCIVYTGDHDASREQILANVQNRFNIQLNPARVVFLYLTSREWILPSKYPHFTLLGQSLGSLIMGWDAINLLVPDMFVDTMGYAFVIALVKKLFPSMPTGAYVHYPTISTDMLESLHAEVGSGLNAGAGKGAKGKAKQLYWELFAKLYSWVGGSVDVVMTNSSWTQNHVSQLWTKARTKNKKQYPIRVVYPPCAVEELHEKIPTECDKDRTKNLLYIAQFRPEKMHQNIIEAFHRFLREHHASTSIDKRPRLVLIGSVRDDSDEKRVYKLRLQAQEVKDSVDFIVNAKWPQILEHLKTSSVGVNGMWNEHFGIGVVEYQAAGLISVVNDSGGPKEDIVVPIDGEPTGFHASTPEEFADAFARALSLSDDEVAAMRQRARKSSWRFSEQVFREAWLGYLADLVALDHSQKERDRSK
ncbi:glycosyltransferase family 4 protein [Dothistroma septosporum NZE10]|uniref:GDP-Man:Man(3)GlcNAc(2)-PP-Dol alpha-1,2-mannosyltransferase n=1 Tax=Dothistroma septosporum (strain NZE10 / CBS 128990) TaxID=675120 RepID=N1PQ96_DOTSN|nr:glycosyltransferase family 4 protein [Dothistroma septosporum NZE10]